ncbi:hypothetical protein B9Z19DRAFT_1104950, partial [Tuber borchii]
IGLACLLLPLHLILLPLTAITTRGASATNFFHFCLCCISSATTATTADRAAAAVTGCYTWWCSRAQLCCVRVCLFLGVCVRRCVFSFVFHYKVQLLRVFLSG